MEPPLPRTPPGATDTASVVPFFRSLRKMSTGPNPATRFVAFDPKTTKRPLGVAEPKSESSFACTSSLETETISGGSGVPGAARASTAQAPRAACAAIPSPAALRIRSLIPGSVSRPRARGPRSAGPGGAAADGNSSLYAMALSSSGRYAVFPTHAANLVPGDTDPGSDILLADTKTGALTLVSAGPGGVPATGESFDPTITRNGRFVTFLSRADNLVATAVPSGKAQIYVWNRKKNTMRLASVDSLGTPGNDESYEGVCSEDGNRVAFISLATNLVAGDGNGAMDVFLHDFRTGATIRLSVDSNGSEGPGDPVVLPRPSMSKNGKLVAFPTRAALAAGDGNGQEDVYLWEEATGVPRLLSKNDLGMAASGATHILPPSLDPAGKRIVVMSTAADLATGDGNASQDVFVVDLK